MLRQGYLRVGRVAGGDLRLHWTVPLGALLFGVGRFEPWLWLGFLFVIAVHELGHVLVGRRSGLCLTSVDVTAAGGDCRWTPDATPVALAAAAWGGVLAQGLLLATAALVLEIWGSPGGRFTDLAEHALIKGNASILVLNLLPVPPFDGARAWRLLPALRASGWSLRRALYRPLAVWAQRRRDARGVEPQSARPSTRRELRGSSEQPVNPRAEPSVELVLDEDDGPRPSPQAQRELAALLERIEERVAQGRRRR